MCPHLDAPGQKCVKKIPYLNSTKFSIPAMMSSNQIFPSSSDISEDVDLLFCIASGLCHTGHDLYGMVDEVVKVWSSQTKWWGQHFILTFPWFVASIDYRNIIKMKIEQTLFSWTSESNKFQFIEIWVVFHDSASDDLRILTDSRLIEGLHSKCHVGIIEERTEK